MVNQDYQNHFFTLIKRYESAMSHFELEAVVLTTGEKSYYFQDDQNQPFRPYSGAQQWLPFSATSDTYLIIQAGKKPTLIWPVFDDFWHAQNAIPDGDWQTHWHIIEATKGTNWHSHLPEKTAWLGPNPQPWSVPCNGLKNYVDFSKAIKTPYEINAMKVASHRAAKGHLAARSAFLAGESELSIHLAFLQASQQTAHQEPYSGIVALNEHAAILHYELKGTSQNSQSYSLLIDAGATEHGYASDITRTFTRYKDDFSALVSSLDLKQQKLSNAALSGVSYCALHQQALIEIADLLYEHKICSLSVEEQLSKRIPQVFFPHGLGHLLGLQVHDVGGFQFDHTGKQKTPDDSAPFLRLTRTLQENMVVTIEPGLYFIPMLINKMLAEQPKHGCDMAKIESFVPYGGIRIEDNILVQRNKVENITRQAFNALND